MSKLPRIPSLLVIRALKRARFYEYHRSGSHIQLRHPDKLNLKFMNNFIKEKSLWGKLLFVLEQIMIYFPIIPYIFALLAVIIWNLALYTDKIRDYTVLIILFIFLPLLSVFILIKKKEFGAYLRTIGIIIFQFLSITFGSPRFLHQAATIDWGVFQYAIHFVFWYFSFLLIILGLIFDLRSVFIRRAELSKIRKWFSVLYIFLIIFLILYLAPSIISSF